MRTLNATGYKFALGKTIVVIKEYRSGNMLLKTGTVGFICGIEVQTFADLGLFNIRILDMEFGHLKVSMGEGVAKEYMGLL